MASGNGIERICTSDGSVLVSKEPDVVAPHEIRHLRAKGSSSLGLHDAGLRSLVTYEDQLRQMRANSQAMGVDPSAALGLTMQERTVLLHVAEGLTRAEVGRRLCISRQAIDYHLGNLFAKFQVQNAAGLVGVAFATGVLTAHDGSPNEISVVLDE